MIQNLKLIAFRGFAWWKFYWKAITKYQVHSPFVFKWVNEVLEDRRPFYAFEDINALRSAMLQSNKTVNIVDFGAGPNGIYTGGTLPRLRTASLRNIVKKSGSDRMQGRLLFRLVQLLHPKTILEMGASTALGTLYLAKSAGKSAKVVTLEGCPETAKIARLNLDLLGEPQVQVITGPFHETLADTVATISTLDLVFFDGNHQEAPTLEYVEICLTNVGDHTVFVIDDVHWSPGMESAWHKIKCHPQVTMTIDCGYFGCAFFNSTFKVKQHFQVVPLRWKPWMVF